MDCRRPSERHCPLPRPYPAPMPSPSRGVAIGQPLWRARREPSRAWRPDDATRCQPITPCPIRCRDAATALAARRCAGEARARDEPGVLSPLGSTRGSHHAQSRRPHCRRARADGSLVSKLSERTYCRSSREEALQAMTMVCSCFSCMNRPSDGRGLPSDPAPFDERGRRHAELGHFAQGSDQTQT